MCPVWPAAAAGTCSHGRSVLYFAHSIREPQLFPAQPCASVEACNKETVSSDQVPGHVTRDTCRYSPWVCLDRGLHGGTGSNLLGWQVQEALLFKGKNPCVISHYIFWLWDWRCPTATGRWAPTATGCASDKLRSGIFVILFSRILWFYITFMENTIQYNNTMSV